MQRRTYGPELSIHELSIHETSPRPTRAQRAHWGHAVLAVTLVLTCAGRAWVIGHYAEPDGDAKGHLGIARALLSDPFRVAVHWVWPPGYHYVLAVLLKVGFTADGVRFLNCGLAALLPLLVWRYAATTIPDDARTSHLARLTPLLAAVLCAAMPVVNLLGTSGEPGTLFAILVLLSVWGVETERFAAAGCALAAAVMVRYEAFGAVAALAGLRLVGYVPSLARRVPSPLAGACRAPVVLVEIPLVTVAAWLFAHRVADGTWLGFVREIYRYTSVQRQTYFHQDAWTDFLFFPVVQPYYLFGLTLPLFLLGLHRAWRNGFVIPLGIYLFLLASYTMKGVLASGRYYESLTPFLCISAAHGAVLVGERWRPATALAFGAAFMHVVRLLLLTGRWTFHLAW